MSWKKGESQYLEKLQKDYPDFLKYIGNLDSRAKTVIEERLKGHTLREIAAMIPRSPKMGGGGFIKFERVRQIERKACNQIIEWCSHAEVPCL